MELIRYRKTLDVHKNGSQFMLQGFQTADNMSRVIEISLMASGDAIDFPLEKVEALMYVTTPNATEPSINECTIKDNKVVYDVLPIVEEGITTMQLKIIETSTEGATGILACPKFSVEVTKSGVDDGKAEQTTTYTALENAMAKAKAVYDERFLRMELTSDCIFKAYYADGTVYETDLLKKLFLNGNVLLSESFAHGGTGVRAGEDTDNSMYYSNVSKSEALNAKNIMENSEEILEEVKLHGVYTAFNVDFETGEVEYVSPSFKFKIDLESGELDVIGQNYTFDNEVGRIVEEWLLANKIVLSDLQDISSTHAEEIADLKGVTETHTEEIARHTEEITTAQEDIDSLKTRVTPIKLGGTGANNEVDVLKNLGISATAEQLNDVVEDSQWETLHSVAMNIDTTKETLTNSHIINLDMDVSDIFPEYSRFRYVIRKGATFHGASSSANSGNAPYSKIDISCVGCTNSMLTFSVVSYAGAGYYGREYTYVLDKDLISVPICMSTDSAMFDRRLVITFNESSAITDICRGMLGCNIKVNRMYADKDVLTATFTIELQGRRL